MDLYEFNKALIWFEEQTINFLLIFVILLQGYYINTPNGSIPNIYLTKVCMMDTRKTLSVPFGKLILDQSQSHPWPGIDGVAVLRSYFCLAVTITALARARFFFKVVKVWKPGLFLFVHQFVHCSLVCPDRLQNKRIWISKPQLVFPLWDWNDGS